MDEQGGILSGRHAGEMTEGDLGIETALALRVEDLTKELELANTKSNSWEQRFHEKWREVVMFQDTLKDLLIRYNNEGSVDSRILREIAEACEIELTREVSFSGTVAFSGSVEVSIFEDFDRYELSLDSFDLSYGHESIYDLQSDIDSAEEDSY